MFEGRLKPTFLHLPHQDYHLAKRQHAKNTLHHKTKPDSTEGTNTQLDIEISTF